MSEVKQRLLRLTRYSRRKVTDNKISFGLGERIAEVRKFVKLSQAVFAKEIEESRGAPAISEWETVKIKSLIRQGPKIMAHSDNALALVPSMIEVDLEQFRLIGKIAWVGHEVK